jgi:DNA anti-recombination protein RmuC
MDLGEESHHKEPQRVPTNFSYQIPKSKVPKTPQENYQERAQKITTKNNREQHTKALRNHAESSIHAKKIHTRSCLTPDHPTLTQDLTMKLSS